MQLEPFTQADPAVLEGLQADLTAQGYDPATVRAYLAEPNVSMLCMHETAGQKRITAIAAVKRVDSIDLLTTFGDQDIAAYIRSMAAGSIAVITLRANLYGLAVEATRHFFVSLLSSRYFLHTYAATAVCVSITYPVFL